jgi:hypothetical protein
MATFADALSVLFATHQLARRYAVGSIGARHSRGASALIICKLLQGTMST